jgi:energy-coupling factor transporter ATP-binding protein EcfA2
MNWAIETENVSKRYAEVTAVDDLSLRVAEGEIYAFLGLNGAGKTTTIRMLLGMIKPTRGSTKISSTRVNSPPDTNAGNKRISIDAKRSAKMKAKKTLEFIGAIIGAIIGIVIVNTVPLWSHLTHGVILDSWVNILWAANLSMFAQIVGNSMLAVYQPARLYSFVQGIMAAAGLVSVIVFFNVFPLDFSQVIGSWLNVLTKAALILAMFGTSIGIIVYMVRAVIGTQFTPATNN